MRKKILLIIFNTFCLQCLFSFEFTLRTGEPSIVEPLIDDKWRDDSWYVSKIEQIGESQNYRFELSGYKTGKVSYVVSKNKTLSLLFRISAPHIPIKFEVLEVGDNFITLKESDSQLPQREIYKMMKPFFDL